MIEADPKSPPLLRARLPIVLLALAATYFAAGKLGLAVAFVHANATSVWPPTGIALAATLLFGYRVWPAILAGAFLVNATTEVSILTALGISIGNTLEAMAGAWFVNRFAGGAAVFRRPQTILGFTLLAALVSTTVSATIGVLSLWGGGFADPQRVPAIWVTWWLGDAVGALLFTPLIMLWGGTAERGLPDRSRIEAAALAATIAVTGWAVFAHNAPSALLCLPPVVWASYRFGRRGAVTAVFALSAVALLGALTGHGPFIRPTPYESLLFLQAFVGVITLTALMLAAVVRERDRVEHDLRRAHGELEATVQERTTSLRETVGQLEKSHAALIEAQSVAHIGSWEWDVPADRVSWSNELFRIYGLEPQSAAIDYEGFLARVHPDDRDRVAAAVGESFASGRPFEFEHRVVRPDGQVRTLFARGQVVQKEGRTVRMMGTGQDITERTEGGRFRELLHRVTTAANEAGSASDALRAALTEICRFRAWPLGHVCVPASDGSGELVSSKIWYPEEPAGHDEFRRVTEAMRFAPGRGLPGRVFSSGRPAWIPDVAGDSNFPRAKLVADLGLAAAFAFPARVGDEVLAVLEFFTTAVLPPEPRFLEILHEIGLQLGQVLRRQQSEEALRMRGAQLAQAQAIAHVGSWDWDVIQNRVVWSDELFRIHGREPGSVEVDYEEFLAHVHPADRLRIDRAVRSALADGEQFAYEYTLVRPDGSERIVQTQGLVERDSQGRALRMYGVCQDVTERREAEEALRDSEQRYRFVADYSTDVITVLRPDGVCTYASPAVRALLGYTPEEIVGRPVAWLVHPADVESVEAVRRAILKSFASQSAICRLQRKSGGWIWAETTSRGVRGPGTGLVQSVVSVTRNVTDRVQAAEVVRLLQRVTAIANEASTVESAMKSALEAICQHTGWPIGHVYMPSRTAEDSFMPMDIWHVERPERFERFRVLSEATPLGVGHGHLGRVLASGGAEWVADLSQAPDFVRKPATAALGLRSAFAFPIRGGGETLAVLEFLSTEVQPADETLHQLMENVGLQLGQVVSRHWTEAALKASEVRFRAVAETANDGILTIDDESRIIYCNDAVERIFGHDAHDLVGQPLTMLMPEPFRSSHLEGIQHFLETGQAPILGETVELMGLHRDGHEIPIELSIAAWATQERRYFTGIVRDVSPRKRAEALIHEKMDELSRSNAELALFTYVVSHDLREPLRTVASNVRLLERRLGGAIDPAAQKSIGFAIDGVQRLQELIEDLLAYSRVGTEGRQFEPVDVGGVVDEVIGSLRVTIEAEGGRVTRGDLPRIWADKVQLGQLFQNLLSNALKFHDERPPRVHVSARREGSEWVLSVRDDGIGFSPEYADHVFTIFQRLHTAQKYPGTGIGLAICRKIVERHGGRIWAESEPGKGSVFHFSVPARD